MSSDKQAGVDARHLTEQVEAKVPPDHRGDLRDALRRSESIEAGEEGALQRVGDLDLGQRRGQFPPALLGNEHSRLEQAPPHFLCEERDACRCIDDPLDEGLRQRPLTAHRVDQPADVGLREGLELDSSHDLAVDPRIGEIGTSGHDEKEAAVGDPTEEALEEVEGGRIAPLHVVDQEHQGLLPAEGEDPLHEHLDGPLQPTFGAERRQRWSRDPQHGGDQAFRVGKVDACRLQAGPDALEAGRRVVLSLHADALLDHVDDRPQHAHLRVGRAGAVDPAELLIDREVSQLLGEP